MKIIKGGPAFTLKIVSKNCDKEIYMDVDLVPCFVCDKSQLPYMLDETKMQLFENKVNIVEYIIKSEQDIHFFRVNSL